MIYFCIFMLEKTGKFSALSLEQGWATIAPLRPMDFNPPAWSGILEDEIHRS